MSQTHGGVTITLSSNTNNKSNSNNNRSNSITNSISNASQGSKISAGVAKSLRALGTTKYLHNAFTSICEKEELLFNEELFRDLSGDVSDIFGNSDENLYFYPFCELESASVLNFMKAGELEQDTFAQMLIQSYRATKRTTHSRLRLSFISTDNSSPGSLEFSSESEYWGLIGAIRASMNATSALSTNEYHGRCTFIPSNSTTNDAPATPATTKRGSVLGLLSFQSKDESKCVLTGKTLSIREATESGSEIVRIHLLTVKLIVLSNDYLPYKPLLLEAQLRRSNGNECLCCLDPDGKQVPTTSQLAVVLSRHARRDTILLPLSVEELQSGKVSGIDKLAILRGVRMSGAEGTISAYLDIPFQSFVRNLSVISRNDMSSIGRPNTTSELQTLSTELGSPNLQLYETIGTDITLNLTSDLPAAYRIVIKSASSLLGDTKRPPSCYCTVYLVNEKGDRLTINTVDARTSVVNHSSDPEWNQEFLLRWDGQDIAADANAATGGTNGSVAGAKSTSAPETPTGVMIKIRDSSSGILRHKHVGQVVVPISCFIYQLPATFTLPLDPTYRMLGLSQASGLGEIHLLTELVSISPTTGAVVRVEVTDETNGITSQSSNGNLIPPHSPGASSPKSSPADLLPATAILTPKIKKSSGKFDAVDIPPPPPTTALVISPKVPRTKSVGRSLSSRFTAEGSPSPIASGRSGMQLSRKHAAANDCMLPNATGTFSVSESKDVGISYSLRACSSWSTWWPVRVLSNGEARGHCCCKPAALKLRMLYGYGGTLANCEEARSHGGGAVTSEAMAAEDGSSLVTIPWSQVVSSVELTEAVLMVHIMIHGVSKSSAAGDRGKDLSAEEIVLIVGPCPATLLNLTINHRISMCFVRGHIESLVDLAINRWGIDLSSDESTESTTHSSASRLSFDGNRDRDSLGITAISNTSPASGGGKADDLGSIMPLARNIAEMLETLILSSDQYVASFRALAVEKLSEYRVLFGSLAHPISASEIIDGHSEPLISASVEMYYSKACTFMRAKVYHALLSFVCREFARSLSRISSRPASASEANSSSAGLPRFTLDAVRSLVEENAAACVLASPILGDSDELVGRLSNRYAALLESADKNIRDYVLFAPDIDGSLPVLEELLRSYHNSLRFLFFPYVSSKEAFYRLSDPAVKMSLLKLLITKNYDFENRVLAIFSAFGYLSSPPLILVERREIHSLLEWFTLSLMSEIKTWLANILQHSATTKTNKFELPWDAAVIEESKALGSDLPETLTATLRVYLDLLIVDLCPAANRVFAARKLSKQFSKGDLTAGLRTVIGDTSSISGRDKSNTTNISLDGQHSNGSLIPPAQLKQQIDRDVELLSLNERVLAAICKAFMLLGEEYKRCLQRSHWEQGDRSSGELNANIEFLASIGNDSHRILFEHVYPAIAHHRTFLEHDSFIKGLFDEYSQIAEMTSKQVCKALFVSLHTTLIDFEHLWATVPNLFVSITSVLNLFIRDIGKRAVGPLLQRIMGHCVDVCLMRLTLMIRDKVSSLGASGSHWTSAEVSKLVADIDHLLAFFGSEPNIAVCAGPPISSVSADKNTFEISKDDYLHRSSLRLRIALQNLCDLKELFVLSFEKEEFATLVRSLVRRYRVTSPTGTGGTGAVNLGSSNTAGSNSILSVVTSNLLSCVVNLRPDGGPAIQTFVHVILENHGGRLGSLDAVAGAVNGLHTVDFVDDVFVRAFGHSDPSTSSVNGTLVGSGTSGNSGVPGNAGSTNNAVSTPSKFALGRGSLVGTPFTLKQLREKTSDVLGGIIPHRKHDAHGHGNDLMRSLGLVDDFSDGMTGAVVGCKAGASAGGELEATAEGSVMSAEEGGDDQSSDGVSVIMSDAVRDANCMLSVSNIRVRGITSVSMFSTANPYVAITVAGKREKTPVCWGGGKACEWKSVVLVFRHLPLHLQKMTVNVFDKERIRRKRFLGSVVVSLAGVDIRGIQGWFALEGGEGGSNGEVFLMIQLSQ